MKVSVLYSPSMLLACFGPPKSDRLVKVWEGDIPGTSKGNVADQVWRIFNGEDLHSNAEREIFLAHALAVREKRVSTDHTSMSVGDAVQFEDGEILQCASVGWEVSVPGSKEKADGLKVWWPA